MAKKKKYANGTGSMGIESPDQALAENQINIAKAKHEAMTDPWVMGLGLLGNMGIQVGNTMMAFGGQAGGPIPVEAEGEEVLTKGNGESFELKGPKHKDGGIDLDLDLGDKIFSDRVSKDGKTMAEREKARQKSINKLKKLLEDRPGDSALKRTLKRTEENNKAQEEADLAVQDVVNMLAQTKKQSMAQPDERQEAAFGLNIDPKMLMAAVNAAQGQAMPDIGGSTDDLHPGSAEETYGTPQGNTAKSPSLSSPGYGFEGDNGISSNADTGEINDVDAFNAAQQSADGGNQGSEGTLGMTMGDVVGMGGNLFSSIMPLMNTMKARAGDRPNQNYYKDYGKDGLKEMEQMKDYVAQQHDNTKKDIRTNANTAKRANRQGARGVNSQRAMDLASEQAANKGYTDSSMNFAKQMMSIMGQQAGMEDAQDRMVMGGNEKRDMRDRADRDNHYTNLGADYATMGEGIQRMGADMNDVKQNDLVMKMLNQLSKYGLEFDREGNVVKAGK